MKISTKSWRYRRQEIDKSMAVVYSLLTDRGGGEAVAEIVEAGEREGVYLTHCNVRLRVYNGYVPAASEDEFLISQLREVEDTLQARDMGHEAAMVECAIRRIELEKGNPVPRFDASEDGLPNPENGDFDCPKAAAMRACPCGFCEAIRRLAASGQGAEGWTIQVKCGGPDDERGIWAVDSEGSSIWLAAAPTQEKGNG